jgi:hypothetical protein
MKRKTSIQDVPCSAAHPSSNAHKRLRLASSALQLQSLSDELILQCLNHLDYRSLLLASEVDRHLHRLANDDHVRSGPTSSDCFAGKLMRPAVCHRSGKPSSRNASRRIGLLHQVRTLLSLLLSNASGLGRSSSKYRTTGRLGMQGQRSYRYGLLSFQAFQILFSWTMSRRRTHLERHSAKMKRLRDRSRRNLRWSHGTAITTSLQSVIRLGRRTFQA